VASARAEAAAATLDELTEGFRSEEIEQARAALRAAERRRLDATRDLERARNLYEDGAISEQALDDRETVATVAESEMQGASERLRLLESGTRSERISAQRAALAAAEAEAERVEALLEYARITAPNAGLITIRHREPGEIVSAGAPVLTLMNPDDRWVRIYVRADRVGQLSIGQTATITADAYPERTYTGRVVFIASEAEFTPRDVQTTEERVKLVYRIKVQIDGDPSFDLKPGLAADVRLDTDAG
jgi:HlyD family secretion protein